MGNFWICNECLAVFLEAKDAAPHVENCSGWIYQGAWGPDGMGAITWLLTGHEMHSAHFPGHAPADYYLNRVPHPKPWEDFARHVIVTAFRGQGHVGI